MDLSRGRDYLAIPGPSVMPDRVLRAMHRGAPNIYAGELFEMLPGIAADLKAIAGTRHHVAMYIANGHGVWEASLANVLSRGDKVLVAATGRFGKGWGAVAESLGATVEVLDFGLRSALVPARLEERLAADRGHEIKAVFVTHVDTATSALSDVAAARAALDAAGHPALLMSDNIASLACDGFEMDAWGVDVMIAASQKGLMTPPGMAFVFFNDRADAARDRADCVTSYWDWRPRMAPDEMYQYFFGTAPTHHLYGLREALAMIAEEGLGNVLDRHEALSAAIWAAVEVWGGAGPLEFNIENPAARSRAVTTLRIPRPHAEKIRAWVEANTGLTLGLGIGMEVDGAPADIGHFRIGHMGHLNAQMVMGALGSIEAALTALGIDHGRGALDAAADSLAKAVGAAR